MEVKKQNKFALFAIIGLFAIVVLLLTDILIGMSNIGFKDIIDSIFNYNKSKEHLIITTIRLPRVLLCILVGASMAISGLIMQNLTRNPLASPQVLGINSGATLAVVIIMVFLPQLGYKIKILVFWMIGGVHHAQFIHILAILPWFIVSILLITVISNSMDTLKMGDSIAISLGENVKLTKIISTITVILLSSSSVAIAGPISFVGLITPHIVSKFGVRNFRGNFILCGIYGGNLLLLSDIVSKLLKYPYESPVGIVTAFIGAVFYIFLANKEMKRGGVSEK